MTADFFILAHKLYIWHFFSIFFYTLVVERLLSLKSLRLNACIQARGA